MASKEKTEVEGVAIESLPNAMFRVKLANEQLVLCQLSGKMRQHHIKVMPGDTVRLEMTPYDQARGRIIFRLR